MGSMHVPCLIIFIILSDDIYQSMSGQSQNVFLLDWNNAGLFTVVFSLWLCLRTHVFHGDKTPSCGVTG
uniref:Uncharacterized protein n=1 Tax=Arundo donax TaxID=35708 RepID=A0A0A8XVK6_ARUDO